MAARGLQAELIVRVPERGSVVLGSREWTSLANAPEFWGIVERGLLTVERLPGGAARLHGSCYVGRCTLNDGTRLELTEKVDGALSALLRHATHGSFRVEVLPASTGELNSLVGLLAQQFVREVRRYLTTGRDFRYQRHATSGPLAAGRLLLPETARLRARGLGHLMAFDRDKVSFATELNAVVFAALREISSLGLLGYIDAATVSTARALGMVFDDSGLERLLGRTHAAVASFAAGLLVNDKRSAHRDLLALAGVLLNRESFGGSMAAGGMVPRSWFLNLETLFESAVRNVLTKQYGMRGAVTSGRQRPRPIFGKFPGLLSANPDLVIEEAARVIVGDVKYKAVGTTASAADIYQLLVHATAFEAREAFLVFPDRVFAMRELGASSAGPRVQIFTLDVASLDEHVSMLVGSLRNGRRD